MKERAEKRGRKKEMSKKKKKGRAKENTPRVNTEEKNGMVKYQQYSLSLSL